MSSLLDTVVKALNTYQTALRDEGYSRKEVVHQMFKMLGHPITDASTILSETNQMKQKEGVQSQIKEEDYLGILTEFLKKFKSIPEGLTSLLVEVSYRTSILNQQEPLNDPNIQQSQHKQPPLKCSDSEKTVKERKDKKEKKRKNPMKPTKREDKTKVRAIDQIKMQAQNESPSKEVYYSEQNLAQIKAYQQLLKAKIMSAQGLINEAFKLEEELKTMSFGRPLFVVNL